jgi:outer membrane protein
MRKMLFTFALLCAFIIPQSIFSAELKIGCVDLDRVMTGAKSIRRVINSMQDDIKKQQELMTDQLTRFKVLTESYSKQRSILSDEQRKTRIRELEDLKAAIEEKESKLNRMIRRSERDLIEPAIERVDLAIKAIGIDGGYDLVLRNDSVLFYSKRCDITEEVITMIDKLDQEEKIESSIPGENDDMDDDLDDDDFDDDLDNDLDDDEDEGEHKESVIISTPEPTPEPTPTQTPTPAPEETSSDSSYVY